jgi:hypothetical protein
MMEAVMRKSMFTDEQVVSILRQVERASLLSLRQGKDMIGIAAKQRNWI